jgi:hypothetical protein
MGGILVRADCDQQEGNERIEHGESDEDYEDWKREKGGGGGGGLMLSFASGRDSEMLLPKKTATTTIANNITIPAMCTGNKCGLSTSIYCNQDLARGCTVSQR